MATGPTDRDRARSEHGRRPAGDLPEAAVRRLESSAFSSGLSVPDFAACLDLGLQPVALVQGFCVMQWGWYGPGSGDACAACRPTWAASRRRGPTRRPTAARTASSPTSTAPGARTSSSPGSSRPGPRATGRPTPACSRRRGKLGAHGVIGVVDRSPNGAVGILRNYYASLLFPPDKTSDIPDIWNPNEYDKAKWRGLLCINFDMTGDTWDPAKLEGVRQLVDIYHYLQSQGVAGRWVKVYRPIIQGDDPTMYFQRLSRDRLRGLIIPKHPAPGPVIIKPKGLLPEKYYDITFQESDGNEKRTGGQLDGTGHQPGKNGPRRTDLFELAAPPRR